MYMLSEYLVSKCKRTRQGEDLEGKGANKEGGYSKLWIANWRWR